MFYSPDILKRKEGFSVIWLAATLGAKSTLKKLQKRDILSVNVPQACVFLSTQGNDKEPLALRLSSNLMYGVTRIFSQQYQFFYGDVSVMHTRLKKETLNFNAPTTILEDLPSKTSARKASDLVIPDSETFIPDFGIVLPPEYALPSLSDDSPPSSPLVFPLSDSIHSTPLQHADFSLSDPSWSLNSGFDDVGGDTYGYDDDDGLGNVDDTATLNFGLDVTPLIGRRETGSVTRKRAYTSVDDDEVRRIAMEDHDVDFDDGGFGFGGEMGFDGVNFEEYRTPPQHVVEDGEVAEVVNDEGQVRRKRRRVHIVEDDNVTLTEENKNWTERYKEIISRAQVRRDKLDTAKMAKQIAERMVWSWNNIPSDKLPPNLHSFFSKTALLAKWKPRTAPPPKKNGEVQQMAETDIGMGFGETGGFGDGGGFDSIDYVTTEIGRAADEPDTMHSSIQLLQMPWANLSSRQTSRDPSVRPSSPAERAGLGRSSISRGFFSDFSMGGGSPGGGRSSSVGNVFEGGGASGVPVNSGVERELLEKESKDFYEYLPSLVEI